MALVGSVVWLEVVVKSKFKPPISFLRLVYTDVELYNVALRHRRNRVRHLLAAIPDQVVRGGTNGTHALAG